MEYPYHLINFHEIMADPLTQKTIFQEKGALSKDKEQTAFRLPFLPDCLFCRLHFSKWVIPNIDLVKIED